MTEQVVVNARAVRALAGRLESLGYDGDAHKEAERIAANLWVDGWRPIDKPIPVRGPGGSREAIEAALKVTADAVAASRARTPVEAPTRKTAT